MCVGGIACECVLIGSRRRPRALRVGAAGELARWFETAVAFAGEKWAFLVRFLGAEVMAVSVVPCWGCAEVMAVSVVPCWGCAVVLLVSASPGRCVLCANSPCEALMRA